MTDVITEIITVTKIVGRSVSYSGSSMFDECDISCFPVTPKIGMKFILKSDMAYPSKITEYR